jgi:protein TonB
MRYVAEINMAVMVAMLIVGSAVASAQNADEVYEPGKNGISSPEPIKRVNPRYPQAAKEAGIEGTVLLRVIVRADGTVGDISVERSLDKDHGIDDAAITAAEQWVFEPARRIKDNQPVAVRVTIEMMFTLK